MRSVTSTSFPAGKSRLRLVASTVMAVAVRLFILTLDDRFCSVPPLVLADWMNYPVVAALRGKPLPFSKSLSFCLLARATPMELGRVCSSTAAPML